MTKKKDMSAMGAARWNSNSKFARAFKAQIDVGEFNNVSVADIIKGNPELQKFKTAAPLHAKEGQGGWRPGHPDSSLPPARAEEETELVRLGGFCEATLFFVDLYKTGFAFETSRVPSPRTFSCENCTMNIKL